MGLSVDSASTAVLPVATDFLELPTPLIEFTTSVNACRAGNSDLIFTRVNAENGCVFGQLLQRTGGNGDMSDPAPISRSLVQTRSLNLNWLYP